MITSLPFPPDLNFGSSLAYNLVNIVSLCVPARRRNTAQQTKSIIVGENCRNLFQIIVPHPIFLPVYVLPPPRFFLSKM